MSGPNFAPLLIECGFRASLPAGLAWAATRMTSRSSAATRHYIWACAIAISLLLPLATILTPRWNVAAPEPLARVASSTRIEAAPSSISGLARTERIGEDAAQRAKGRQPSGLTPWMVATSIWMTGSVVVFCYVLMGHFAAWRLYLRTRPVQDSWIQVADQLTREAGLSTVLRVVESPALSAPIVLYLWRSIIVLPEAARRWSRARIRAVLLHEFAHIKRNDMQMQSIAQLACAVYWFNPLVWFAAHQLRLERERACDDFVLLCGVNRADYATHLFEIARAGSASMAPRLAIGLAENRCQLEQRLVAIVNPQTPRHSTTILGRFMVALPMLLVALAAGAVQITARATPVPVRPIKIPAPAIPVRAGVAELLIGGRQAKMRSVPTESSADKNSRPEAFHWAARMHEHQTIEVHLGRGSIQVLPSEDDTVRVQARSDNPSRSEVQAVATSTGVKFCDIVKTAGGSRNYCKPDEDTARIREDQPATEFVIYVPKGLQFAGGTVLGNIRADHPTADCNMATASGDITFELDTEKGANFNGNVIEGSVDADFPLTDNTPTLPTGGRPATKAPRIVHAIIGSGGPRLSAAVVKGNIRLLRQPAE
ncbi:MAG: M56 family metallopeptidase [Candidatus Sulfotelmatobacter sp.]